MSPDSFREKIAKYWKLQLLGAAVFSAALSTAAIPTLFVVRRLDRTGFDAVCVAVIALSYGASAVLLFYVMTRFGKKRLRNLQGDCPGCGRLLLGKVSRGVIATKRCPHCGIQVLN